MNRIFAAFALFLAACSPPAFAEDERPRNCPTSHGDIDSVFQRATWTREVGYVRASGSSHPSVSLEVDISLSAGIEAGWTDVTWRAELVMPRDVAIRVGTGDRYDPEGDAVREGLGRTDSARFIVHFTHLNGVEPQVSKRSHGWGERDVDRGFIVVTIYCTGTPDPLNSPQGETDGDGRVFYPVDFVLQDTPG